ncbi:MAG: class I poly(R)-hydroxyalkanoic acid synthase [Rhizobiaceae bacterium]|nr:class I poly(R)-hydroxyalkanoic acid synthase [Rhizobiaceae bacterium]
MAERGKQDDETKRSPGNPNGDQALDQYLVKDPQRFALNLARTIEQAGKAAAAWAAPRESGELRDQLADPAADMVKTFNKLTEFWLAEPTRALEAQTRLFGGFMDVWANSIRRMGGEQPAVPPPPADKRFADPEWADNAFFSFLREAWLVTSRWASDLVEQTEGLDENTRQKARFYVKQLTTAASPANFVLTNPELFKETVASHGENLIRGMKMLAEDIQAGHGEVKLRQSDPTRFKVGENLATTPGKVVARSAVAEIIQYEPTTDKVLKRPLLISPPWINKFYILDLNAEKSFIRWAVEQGHSVFVISWVNPNESHGRLGWEDYIEQGLVFGLDAVEKATGAREVNAVGYCVGGTLLAAALALFAKTGEDRIKTVTFLTTQVDFTYAGDLKIFVDEEQVTALEQAMAQKGFLEGTRMATAFNMLRSSELVWPYVVNNYVRGKAPLPFDLLYWNSDSTRMAAANHSFYLRNCYLENNLTAGRMELGGRTLRLSDVKVPVYNLATKEDHIAPARSVFLGCRFFGGEVDYVMAGSGHIAGVVNPPAAGKYQFWSGDKPEGDFDAWVAAAKETKGSWWPHWHKWITGHDARTVAAPRVGESLPALAEAPGDYVRVRY